MEISFKIKPHNGFIREGRNLVAIKRISLLEALEAKSFDLTNLDGTEVSVVVTDILTPTTLLKVPNEGFYFKTKTPFEEEDSANDSRLARGDLYVKFNIIFPSELTVDQKDSLRDILQD